MINRCLWSTSILVFGLACGCLSVGNEPLIFEEDVLELMDPPIIPDPVNGERWWYAPSHRAHLYSHKYRYRLEKMLKNKDVGIKVDEEYRLPRDLVPTLYSIRLLPFIEQVNQGNYTIDGSIDIFLTCQVATQNITLNAVDISIGRVTIQDTETMASVDIGLYFDEQKTREMITIRTIQPLVAGKQYKVSILFTSVLNDLLKGFYRSSYLENGVRKWLGITDFEAPDARRAFPCFDEPNMKANFSIILGRKTSMTSASNMPLLYSNPIDGMPGYVWDYYATSVKMSTYLVCMLVSEFIAVPSDPGAGRIPFRIMARPDARNLTEYARNVGPRISDFFENYFQINYPLPKQDMAAIPDFSSGAMENFGLITYREVDLLIDPKTAIETTKQRVPVVIAHELAHQWFGNLVTMDWWNTIWLNEGFASYLEFFGTDAVEPTFRVYEQFVTYNLQYIFGIDGLETSRPINLLVNAPSQISSLFDAITYDKGSCIVRMCADMLGVPTFNRGLTRYLNARAFANADQDDLWQALQEQADLESVQLPATVKEIMDTWTFQMGFPYITVERNYATGSALVTQERFLLRKSGNLTDTNIYQWWVPLTYTTAADPVEQRSSDWLSKDQTRKSISNLRANSGQWVLFNVDQQNYYRVAYDEPNYNLLCDQLLSNHVRISINNRAQLLDDTFNMALIHQVAYKHAMDLSLYLKTEREYVPWRAVLNEMDYIDIMLYNTPTCADWKNYVTSLIEPYYGHVGFLETELDLHLTIYSRTDAMNWACRLGIADCVQRAREKYATQMAQPDNSRALSPNQRTVILRTGIENGGKAEYDFAFDQYKSKADVAYLTAMTSSRDSSTLSNLLEIMLDANSGINRANINTLFNGVASNPIGNPIAFNFLINRWSDIENSLGTSYFVNFFRYVCNRLNTQKELDKLLKLRADHSNILGTSPTVQQGVDVVVENVKWLILHEKEIGDWLPKTEASTVPPTTPSSSRGMYQELNTIVFLALILFYFFW